MASYSVVVGNNAGSTTSSSATLSLSGTVSITAQPSSQAVSSGADATFDVTATGSGTLTYQWRYNGGAISGATDSTYTRPSVTGADAGSYSVIVSNSFSSATSSDAVLSVVVGSSSIIARWNFNDTNNYSSPAIAVGTGTASLYGGTVATNFAGSSNDTNAVNWGWSINGYAAPGGVNKSTGIQFALSTANFENIRISFDERATSTASKYFRVQYTTNGTTYVDAMALTNTLTGTFATFSNSLSTAAGVRNNPNFAFRIVAEYQSTAQGGTGTADYVGTSGTYAASGNARYDMVTVYGDALVSPSIVTQPQSQTKDPGDTVIFSVSPTGSAPFTYKWRRNGSPLTDGGNITGSASAVLTLASVSSSDAASYSVIVSNSVGSATSANAALTVNVSPVITTQPSSRTNVAGTTATFNVSATGTALQYQWRKNGNILSNGANVLGATSSALTISGVTATDAASYSVDVSNSVDVVTSSAAVLTIVDPPSISSNPVSQTVNAGNLATFSVVASGTPPLSYQWRRNGATVSGETDSAINIANAQHSNAGSYDVVVTNLGGSATSLAAVLTVLDPPSITAQPISQTTFAGQDIVFSASVSGVGPFTYQWRQDGENLVDAGNVTGSQTASLTVGNVHDADNGAYSVVIGNSAGSTTSADGQLTVVPFANRLLNITTNLDGTPALLWSVVPNDSYSFDVQRQSHG